MSALHEREYSAVFSYLKSLNFHFLDAWVVQCVDYCKSTQSDISLESLKNVVREQWLLANLRDIKVPAFPPNLTACHKTILRGKYMVQVESMIDCSKSYYSQFQQVQRVNTENIDVTTEVKERGAKAKRCLTFVVSDGVQELHAMEYRPILKIRSNDPELLPGFKMLIIGPVECRKGMILLKDENVRIFGGEVDTLADTHKLKSILLRKLNLNADDYPDVAGADTQARDEGICTIQTENQETDNDNIDNLLSQNDDLFLSVPDFPEDRIPDSAYRTEESNREGSSVNRQSDMGTIQLNDDFFIDDSTDDLGHFLGSRPKKHSLPLDERSTPSPKKVSYDYTSNGIPRSRHSIDNSDTLTSETRHYTVESQLSKPSQVQTKLSTFFKSKTASRQSDPRNGPSVSGESSRPAVNLDVSPEPFVYLRQILSLSDTNSRVFTIKGVVLTLKNKIAIDQDEYKLRGTVTDGSALVDVDFSTDILESFLAYSPCEMQTLMKAKQTNSAMASRIREAFKKAQENFISLNCLMKIKTFPGPDTVPLVVSIEQLTQTHLARLQDRLKPYTVQRIE